MPAPTRSRLTDREPVTAPASDDVFAIRYTPRDAVRNNQASEADWLEHGGQCRPPTRAVTGISSVAVAAPPASDLSCQGSRAPLGSRRGRYSPAPRSRP